MLLFQYSECPDCNFERNYDYKLASIEINETSFLHLTLIFIIKEHQSMFIMIKFVNNQQFNLNKVHQTKSYKL